jgi:hypothetical protein
MHTSSTPERPQATAKPQSFVAMFGRCIPGRRRRSQAIRHVDADSLLEHQMDANPHCFDPNEHYASPAVPLDADLDLAQYSTEGSITNTFPNSISRVLPIHAPADPTTFYRNLLRLHQDCRPPAPLTKLIEYHASQPRLLRSVRSYNFLMALAIQHTSWRAVRMLREQMSADKIGGDAETRELFVRFLVRTGHWERAWQYVHSTLRRQRDSAIRDLGVDRQMVRLWLELFGSEKRGHNPRPPHALASQATNPSIAAQPGDLSGASLQQLQRKHSLLLNRAPLNPTSLPRSNAYAVYTLVHAFLRAGEVDVALRVTREYLSTLPAALDERWRRRCSRIIDLHAAGIGVPGSGLTRHATIRSRVLDLLALAPAVAPTANTLGLLLSSLRRCRLRYSRGRRLVHQFVRRWGSVLVDDGVQRRLVDFAIQEGKFAYASSIISRRSLEAPTWRKQRYHVMANGASSGGNTPDSTASAPGTRAGLREAKEVVYPGQGRQRWQWTLLKTRLRRFTLQRGTSCRIRSRPL